MNREILFRGKHTDSGAWKYGDLSHATYSGETLYWILEPKSGGWGYKSYAVDPSTVGEYAGWTDKNATRIFEGDIVSYNGTVHKVVFENRGYSGYFGIVVGDNETWPFSMSVPPNMMEVIGNVHDNPELLIA